jgi:hypothetical protein
MVYKWIWKKERGQQQTPRSRTHLEKIIVAPLVNKLPTLHHTYRFVNHIHVGPLFWATGIHSTISHSISYHKYCNRFDQRVDRQQLCKHGLICNNRRGCVFYIVRPSSSGTTGLCSPFLSNGSVNTFPCIGQCYESGDVINNRDYVFRGVCAECLYEKGVT